MDGIMFSPVAGPLSLAAEHLLASDFPSPPSGDGQS